MLDSFKFLLRLLLFWLIVFSVNRLVFIFATLHLVSGIPYSEVFYAIVSGLKLDLATSASYLLLPFLLLFIYSVFSKPVFIRLNHISNYIIIIIYNLISFGEIGLYQEWRTKLNIQALLHFQNPAEVFNSTSWQLILLFVIPLLLFSFVYIKFYNKVVKPFFKTEQSLNWKRKLKSILLFIPAAGIIFIFMRGGFQAIPISESDATYSRHQPLNDAALNPFRHLIKDYIEYRNNLKENPHTYMELAKAKSIVADLYKTSIDTTEIFINTGKPNIVFILLESWSANLVKSYGGDAFTPFFDSLSGDGIKFTNFYPAGYVSDQGIPAILSSYPASFKIAVINQFKKIPALPCINIDLEKAGYTSSFVFGGDLNYGNLKTYVYNKGFDFIKEEKDFSASLTHGKLGIHDQPMAKEFAQILNTTSQPFMACWFTLSSHSPYDFPNENYTDTANDYEQSVHYTDNALRSFFAQAKTQTWFSNTLFVLVADHSHNSRKNFDLVNKEYHRIPMLFYGNVIKPEWCGKAVSDAFCQLDITPTLLKQLGLSAENYPWGKNMFNPHSPHFAYYCYYYGAGMVTDSVYVSLHRELNDPIDTKGKTPEEINKLTEQLKAFQQVFYDDFLAR